MTHEVRKITLKRKKVEENQLHEAVKWLVVA
jgi:hypothetical protein